MAVAGPFVAEAKARGLYVAAPRGPSRSGKKRFGWGSPDRALDAVKRAITEAQRKAGELPLPVLVVGAGRGGKLGLEIAARSPGLFSAVGSVGGIFDPGGSDAAAVAGLKGVPVFLGVARNASPELLKAMQRGRENMAKLGVKITWGECRDGRRPPDERHRGGEGDPRRARAGARRGRPAAPQASLLTAAAAVRRRGRSPRRSSGGPRRGRRPATWPAIRRGSNRERLLGLGHLDDGRGHDGRAGVGPEEDREAVVPRVRGPRVRVDDGVSLRLPDGHLHPPVGEVPPESPEDGAIGRLEPLVEELLQVTPRELLEDGAQVRARRVPALVPPAVLAQALEERLVADDPAEHVDDPGPLS